ncbi:amidohydrolase [Kineococcus gynurae]|uniref:Amidohydrolase n=1 Tax=Kineococcus gynurae TaxID=452979 RepID=A0ABV5LRQ9_9ACTN
MADLVLHSGRVFDGRRRHPTATAVAVTDGRIVAVGTDAEVRAAVGRADESVDLAGRLLHPGFVDAHLHPVQGGIERLGCDLSETRGVERYLDVVSAFAAATTASPDPWILGGGWAMAEFPGGVPRRELLDARVPDRPVFLVNRDHHGAWANSRALELAGIDASTPDPADGRIERDPDGRPTGTLHEGAMELVVRVAPRPTAEQVRAGLLAGQAYLHSLGVTGWQDAIVGEYAGMPDSLDAYVTAVRAGELTARVVGAQWWPRGVEPDGVAAQVERLAARRDRVRAALGPAGRFRADSVKIMLDGVAENQTASLLEPYLDRCGCAGADRGLSYLDAELLRQVVPALDEAGLDVHVHVIGDRAARDALDAVAAARRSPRSRGGRHHLAHLQLVAAEDVPRFGELGVAANAQALWACNDAQMTELTVPFLGSDRVALQYPFAGLVRGGARLAMGSDWPVSSPDPWAAIAVATTRRPPGSPGTPPLVAEQAVGLEVALGAYTAGSAWVNRREDETGLVRVGALADLVVASVDPFELPLAELADVRSDLVLVDGRAVAG